MCPLAGKNVRGLAISQGGLIASGAEDSSARVFPPTQLYKQYQVRVPLPGQSKVETEPFAGGKLSETKKKGLYSIVKSIALAGDRIIAGTTQGQIIAYTFATGALS